MSTDTLQISDKSQENLFVITNISFHFSIESNHTKKPTNFLASTNFSLSAIFFPGSTVQLLPVYSIRNPQLFHLSLTIKLKPKIFDHGGRNYRELVLVIEIAVGRSIYCLLDREALILNNKRQDKNRRLKSEKSLLQMFTLFSFMSTNLCVLSYTPLKLNADMRGL